MYIIITFQETVGNHSSFHSSLLFSFEEDSPKTPKLPRHGFPFWQSSSSKQKKKKEPQEKSFVALPGFISVGMLFSKWNLPSEKSKKKTWEKNPGETSSSPKRQKNIKNTRVCHGFRNADMFGLLKAIWNPTKPEAPSCVSFGKRGSDRLISSRNFCNLSAPQKEILHLKSECLRLRMSLVCLEEFPQGFCSSLPAFVLAKWIILQHQIPTCVKRTLWLSQKKNNDNPSRSCTWFVRLATPPS